MTPTLVYHSVHQQYDLQHYNCHRYDYKTMFAYGMTKKIRVCRNYGKLTVHNFYLYCMSYMLIIVY